MNVSYDASIQQVTLENLKDFNAEQIFTCGQCFRWLEQNSNHYRGVVGSRVIDVVQLDDNTVEISPVELEYFYEYLNHYFDFETDYQEIKQLLIKDDSIMEKAVEQGKGIRILNQEPFEILISFIISGNNNIPRIMKAIDGLSRKYGDYIKSAEEKDYYSFPTPEQLRDVSIEDYRALGVGYRDKYIYHAVQNILNGEMDLKDLENLEIDQLKQALMSVKGIGSKIADCIILFAFGRKAAFPVDTWVKKIMKAFYLDDDTKDREILSFATENFGDHAGIAQQYLFYYSRKLKL